MPEPMSERDLERTLGEIGARLAYPRPTRMAEVVSARLAEPRERSWWTLLRSPRYAFLPVVSTAVLLLVVVLVAVPGARAAADEFLRARGVDIFRVPAVPSASATGGVMFPGERVTLEEARRRAGFTLRLPADERLGVPDEVYVDVVRGEERVTLVYRTRAGIPISPQAGVSAVVVAFRGQVDASLFGKAAGPGTTVEQVRVGGDPGYWLEGSPHLFFYRDRSGNVWDETLRLAGNTLIWEREDVTYRLEAALTRDDALRIAASFR